jgi:metallo-beta-lactamase family protein
MQIEFLGAAQTVTGSMHLIVSNGRKILLDCGMFQGKRAEANERNRNFPFNPKEIVRFILSMRILFMRQSTQFGQRGFSGKFFVSSHRDLCSIMLADSAISRNKDGSISTSRLATPKNSHIETLYSTVDALLQSTD